MNQSLDEFRYQNIGLKIEGFEPTYNQGYLDVVLRVTNYSDKNNSLSLYGSRYVSKKYGILDIYECRPGHFDYKNDNYKILPNSFVDFHIEFKMKTVTEEDRFEIKLNNATIIIQNTIQNQRFVWRVVDFYETQNITDASKANNIIRIEHLDTLEEKIGIILQNFSLKKEGDYIETYCEILSSGDIKESSFWITAVAYDKNNKIAGYNRELLEKERFLDFKVLRNRIYLDKPLSSIERILIYPEL